MLLYRLFFAIILIIIVNTSSSIAQSDYQQAIEYYIHGDHISAEKKLLEINQNKGLNYYQFLTLLNVEVKLKNPKKYLELYHNAIIEKGIGDDMLINVIKWEKQLFADSISINYRNYLINNYDSLYCEYMKRNRLDKIMYIKKIYIEDQYYREANYISQYDSVLSRKMNYLMVKLDSIHAVDLLTYFDKYGFPKYSEVKDIQKELTILMLHFCGNEATGNYFFEKFDTILREQVFKGNYPGEYYSLFVDGSMRRLREQIYGNFTTRNDKGEDVYTKFKDDISVVNMKRKEIGLIPIELDSKLKGTKLK
jgi:hypothetical protein